MSPLSKSMHQRSISDNIPVEERLKRLRDNVLPEAPYILTVPTTYHVNSHQLNDWRRGIPFAADEQKLQYLSFLSHTTDDTMLKAEGDWDDGNGGIAEKSSQSVSTRRSSSTMSPLPGQEPRRKKITLDDYKKLKPSTANNPNRKLPEKVDAPAAPEKKEVKPLEDVPQQVHKRPLEAISQEKDATPAVQDKNHSPPAKKARISPSPPRDTTVKEGKVENTNAHGFPPLLSPTLPPSIEEELAKLQASAKATTNEKASKKKASEALASSSGQKSRGQSPSSSHVSKPSLQDKSLASNKPDSKILDSKIPATSPDSKETGFLRGVVPQPKQLTPMIDQKEKVSKVNGIAQSQAPSKIVGNGGNEVSSVAGAKPGIGNAEKESLMVKLKIPKSMRKNWAALIRLTPHPRKPDVSHQTGMDKLKDRTKEPIMVNGSEKAKEHQQQRKVPTEQFKITTSKAGEKRRRLDGVNDPEPSLKRQKPSVAPASAHKTPTSGMNPKLHKSALNHKPHTPALNHKPHTPVRPINKSPPLSQSSSIQKPNTSTPKRTIKGTAMQRLTSQEADVRTPSGSARGGTPTAPSSIERGNREGRSVSNPLVGESSGGHGGGAAGSSVAGQANATKAADLWKSEQSKYLNLGRTLKHDADNFLKNGREINPDPITKKQGIPIAVETILCYMLGFTAGDEVLRANGKAGDPSSWRSLIPYIRYAGGIVGDPHLGGLILQLEAVCREIIHVYDIDRLSREPGPYVAEEARSLPTNNEPNSAATTEQASTAAKRREYADFKTKLVENIRMAHQVWQQGRALLPVEKLRESYPHTWEKRAAAPPDEHTKERLVASEYNGGTFYLPLTSTSTGIEAVRFGWSFLKEWCLKFDVKWEGKMGL